MSAVAASCMLFWFSGVMIGIGAGDTEGVTVFGILMLVFAIFYHHRFVPNDKD